MIAIGKIYFSNNNLKKYLFIVLLVGVCFGQIKAISEQGKTVILKEDGTWFYDNQQKSKLHFRFSGLINNSPLTSTPDDDASILAFYNPDIPQMFSKWIISDQNFSCGYLYNRNVGEAIENTSKKLYISFKKIKLNDTILLTLNNDPFLTRIILLFILLQDCNIE